MRVARFVAVLGTAALAMSSSFILSGSAQATGSTALVSCTSVDSVVLYDPPLTFEEQQRHITGIDQYNCLSLIPINLTKASGRVEGNGTTGCVSVGMPKLQEKVRFHNDGVSVIDYTTVVSVRGAVNTTVTHLGTVSSGPYEGAAATKVIDFPNVEFLDCLTGVEQINGVATLELVG